MKLVVNIECPLGLKTPDCYIDSVVNKLGVVEENVWLCDDSSTSWYWILNDVDKALYQQNFCDLQTEFLKLIEKGLVQYFYIGSVDTGVNDTKLQDRAFETY